GTRVVERARDDCRHAYVVQREHLLRELAEAIWTGRTNRRVFAEGGGGLPIHERRSRHEYGALQAGKVDRIEEVMRAHDVDMQRRHGIGPRAADAGDAAAV